ncbi:MAG TPA: hypothetical protein VEQ60_01125 [Longimicrobium sp.]|nr:hypothetical protein [Longimicrobium sp.]
MRLTGHCFRVAALAALLGACEGGTEASVATTMVAASPAAQAAVTETQVADAPAVRITDQRGKPMAGLVVTFAVSAGGGTVAVASATTDAAGRASAGTWTLGAVAGVNTVTASHGGLRPVQFMATGQARVPTTVTALSATTQTAPALAAVPEAPSVRVADQTGRVMAGVAVGFAITAGGGTVAPASVATNAQGVAAAATWTLGAAQQNTVTATVVGLAPVTFNATAQRIPATITATSATSQSAVAGTAVPQAPAVRVNDQTGAPLAGATVTFAVTGGGSVASATATTDAAGLASAGSWTLGATPGENTVTATVGALSVTFTAMGQIPCTVTPFILGSRVNAAWTAEDCRAADGRPRDVYSLTLTGETFWLMISSGSVNSDLVLYDAAGRAVAINDNKAGSEVPGHTPMFVPAGTWRFEATTSATTPPGALGTYLIESGTFDPATSGCLAHGIVPGATAAGRLAPGDCAWLGRSDTYEVILHPGQTIAARMESSAFDAVLELYTAASVRVQMDDDGAGGTNALLTYTYTGPAPALFRLYGRGKSETATGAYTLTLTSN